MTNEERGRNAPEAEIFPIRIDKDGTWYYQGAEMFRKDILVHFFEALRRDGRGKHFLEMQGRRYYIQVEDTPYVVRAVNILKARSPDQQVELVLSDDSKEILDGESLRMTDGNVLYCQVKDGDFEARFSRPAWYQLAGHVEHDAEREQYALVSGGKRYILKADDATIGG